MAHRPQDISSRVGVHIQSIHIQAAALTYSSYPDIRLALYHLISNIIETTKDTSLWK